MKLRIAQLLQELHLSQKTNNDSILVCIIISSVGRRGSSERDHRDFHGQSRYESDE